MHEEYVLRDAFRIDFFFIIMQLFWFARDNHSIKTKICSLMYVYIFMKVSCSYESVKKLAILAKEGLNENIWKNFQYVNDQCENISLLLKNNLCNKFYYRHRMCLLFTHKKAKYMYVIIEILKVQIVIFVLLKHHSYCFEYMLIYVKITIILLS